MTTPAARQLRALDPEQVAVILDALRDRLPADGMSIVEVTVQRQRFHCFAGRHRDGSRVLLAVDAHRSEVA